MVNWGHNYQFAKPAQGSHPHEYHQINQTELDHLKNSMCLFARKFSSDCHIPVDNLRPRLNTRELISAIYGAHKQYINVTNILRSLTDFQVLDNSLYGQDPCPGHHKSTIIIYQNLVTFYPEGESVCLYS